MQALEKIHSVKQDCLHARLREAQLAVTQERIERQVSQLATLQEDRQAEVQSGHNSGLIRDK